MKYLFTAALSICVTYGAVAQVQFEGLPIGINGLSELPVYTVEAPDYAIYLQEDSLREQEGLLPYRFGINLAVALNSEQHGLWTERENGDRVWHLGIQSPDALSLNFHFDRFEIPEGAKVFVYRPDMREVKGAYTRQNASPVGTFAVGIIHGDELIIEYQEPRNARGQGRLHLDTLTHGYRSLLAEPTARSGAKGHFGDSGPCNINVNCPEGLPYGAESRSVAFMIIDGSRLCTGALMNNVREDNTPYFLTARHCLGNTNTNQNWVLYFNYESPTCAGSDGPINQSLSGAQLLGWSSESDFALGRLNNNVPPSYNACFSGWNATDSDALLSRAVGIHHPRGDVKKICFEDDTPTKRMNNPIANQVWYIDQWELGVTEPGSSGSPLFDVMGNSVGLLSGGAAACAGTVNNGQFDYYGRLGVAWDFENTAIHKLRTWLDPDDTGTLILRNSCREAPAENDVLFVQIQDVDNLNCDPSTAVPSLSVINAGSAELTSFQYHIVLNNNIVNSTEWTGTLAPNASLNVPLPALNWEEGLNNLTLIATAANGETLPASASRRAQRSFYVFEDNEDLFLRITTDNFPDEVTWNLVSPEGIELYRGGPYSTPATTINETLCVGSDFCFTLNIFDSGNDGLCCGFGIGSYQIADSQGNVLASGAQFGSVESTLVCRGAQLNDPRLQSRLFLYPNPASDVLSFAVSGAGASLGFLRIYDIHGRLILEESRWKGAISSGRYSIPVNQLAEGLYVIGLEVDGKMEFNKLVIGR